MSLMVLGNPPSGMVANAYYTELSAVGGNPPYTWKPDPPLPSGLEVAPLPGSERAAIRGIPTEAGSTQCTIAITDSQGDTGSYGFTLQINPQLAVSTQHLPAGVKGKPSRRLDRFAHVSTWLAVLALGVPVIGAIWIAIYSFTAAGRHGTYLATGLLTALAAFLGGCLIGFLFGIPRVVSSGQLRLGKGAQPYTPSTNLAEVSDWLTKLLLGAGLVQLTRLGAPLGHLIDTVGAGLTPAIAPAAPSAAAKVMAGAILFGYAATGLLDAYVVTTMWYQQKLEKLNG